MSRFKIVITEFTEETKTKGREWEKGAATEDVDCPGGYGYTPEIQKVVDVERVVFTQNVAEIELVDVIMAVNGIPLREVSGKPA